MSEPNEIVKSGVSVYEIELDLGEWPRVLTHQIPGFYDRLRQAIPSLHDHKCMSGKPGGFCMEVSKGTNFAHVIEHVLIELILLADPGESTYTGWTRELIPQRVYVVHYSAPDFLTGRLAAILAVDLVKRLIGGEKIDVSAYVDLLSHPLGYFTREHGMAASLKFMGEPASVISDIRGLSLHNRPVADGILFSRTQERNISLAFKHIKRVYLDRIRQLWRASFVDYYGKFGQSIIDKIELLNPDKYIDSLVAGRFDIFFRGVCNASQVIRSYDIPINLVIYAVWLYKYHILNVLIDEHKYIENKAVQDRLTKDLEVFFQLMLHHILTGFLEKAPLSDDDHVALELKEFRELGGKKASILIIDDDEMILSTFSDILKYHGYDVLQAKTGTLGLNIVEKMNSELSLVILDLHLPDMSGVDVYHGIAKLNPGMKILITTGYSTQSVLAEIMSHDFVDFLSKPFKVELLMQKIRSLLTEEGTFYGV
ncbi:MAG: response regulator [Deltaproteobacteria bacterium]|nr:response regulator [Deltaproteobacteria bacterium]